MRMIGKLGWWGQCSCCNEPRRMKRYEENQWRKEYDAELSDDWQESNQTLWLATEKESKNDRET
jgi:hypothetical protein